MDTEIDQQLLQFLRRNGPSGTERLLQGLGISQSTFSRARKRLGSAVLVLGQGKNTKTAAVLGARLPVFRYPGNYWADLVPIAPKGYVLVFKDQKKFLIFPDLPFFIWDVRPQGFLGRALAEKHARDLGIQARLTEWSDLEILIFLSTVGSDLIGDLVIGETAFQKAQEEKKSDLNLSSFDEKADRALSNDLPGSSAGGEQPKFVEGFSIVKFSPVRGNFTGDRWSDLLACEEIALNLFRSDSEHAQFFSGEKRSFLRVPRFDRDHSGRRFSVLSFSVVDAFMIGSQRYWSESAAWLFDRALISADDYKRICVWDAFGACIGNTDRHFGNLSFFWDPDELTESSTGFLKLAPIYDMLPMFYAPKDSVDHFPVFQPPVWKKEWLPFQDEVRDWVQKYRERVLSDSRISYEFKTQIKKALDF